MQFIDERNEKFISELGKLARPEGRAVTDWRMACTGPQRVEKENLGELSWQAFDTTGTWGGHDTYYWFETRVEIPQEFDGKCIVFQVKTGREGEWDATNPQFRVYVNGALKQGMDVNHREVILTECARAGEEFLLQLSAYTGNQNFYLHLESEIQVLDRKLEALYYDLEVPQSVLRLLETDSNEAIAIRKALTQALNLADMRMPGSEEFYESLDRVKAYMDEEFYGKECQKSRETIYTVGHTHIDVAWLWPLSVTRDKAVRSFSTALELLRQYPEFIFMSSQPQLYKYVKENAPEIYEEIRQRVREGRWEAEGGMFLEADCNLSSGESLIRQFVYGKRFFKEEFGVDNKILWLPDVFGYSAALPQIMKKCGIRYFMTTKISWSETNKMPNDTFLWEGIDGTRILTHFISARDYNASLFVGGKKRPPHFTTYNGELTASQIKGTWQRYSQKELNNEALMCFGFGDGGGGATREMLENSRRLSKGIPGCPVAKMSTAREFFEQLEKSVLGKEELATWVGELYLEYHRGTYTSMARNKRYNRKGEFLLENLEGLASASTLAGARPHGYQEEMDGLWEILLRNQFHDILPGSSCKEVYEDSKAEYEVLFERGNALKQKLLGRLAEETSAENGTLLVYNPNAFCGQGPVYVEYPEQLANPAAVAADGSICPIQKTWDGRGVFLADGVPAKGMGTYSLAGQEARSGQVHFDGHTVTTPYFAVTLNEAGQFVSFVDRRAGRELLKENQRGNVFVTYEDRPHYYDAWDINEYYTEKPYPIEDSASISVVEDGPVRMVLRIVHTYLQSVIEQDLIFYSALDRIDMDYRIDWKEKNILLRSYFPIAVHASAASYEIQYGSVERPTHKNTSWDQAKFEVCAHKWIDLSEDGYGISVLNDCKYGCDIHDGVIGLTLLKSAVYPNPDADRELHRFSYALCPHKGGWREAGTVQRAYAFNNPMEAQMKREAGGSLAPGQDMVQTDSENAVIEVVKPAYDGRGLIVRLYDAFNRTSDVNLKLCVPVRKAFLCDMLEQDEKELTVEEGTVALHVKPYEIVTVRLLTE